jgi:chemotaxis protein histidine kinase CheA
LRLSVRDNGNGIDGEKIKAKAIEKKLIAGDENLTAQETIDLIFTPEFSTKSAVTEISGRGVGLDAVKFAVEEAGGKVTVKSDGEKGTAFEIFLPH